MKYIIDTMYVYAIVRGVNNLLFGGFYLWHSQKHW